MTTQSPTAWTAIRTLDALKRHRGYSDAKIAELAGDKPRNWATDRRLGRSAIAVSDLDAFGQALRVPPTVFLMDPADAIRWVLDNDTDAPTPDGGIGAPDLGGSRSGCKGGLTERTGHLVAVRAA